MQEEKKYSLDELLRKRRSIRNFNGPEPTEEDFEALAEAGRLAPFAGLVQKDTNQFRHFFLVHRDSEEAGKLKALCEETRREEVIRIKEAHLDEKYPEAAKMAKMISEKPANDIFMSEWLMIVAERGGLPEREAVCLGYVMENMWLKAAERGMAFRVCSGISDIKNKAALAELLGLNPNETYAFDACNIGYAEKETEEPENRKRPETSIQYFKGGK